MKNKYIFIVTFLFGFSSIVAQEAHNYLIINLQSHFFTDKSTKWDGTFTPINPGGEILYERKLNKFLAVSSGLSFTYSSWNYSIGIKSHFKRISHEIFIPVILKSRLHQKFYIEGGIYPGWLINGKELYKNNSSIKNWRDNTHTTNYNSIPKFTMDLFFGTGIITPAIEKHSFSFIPFIKYKMNENWVDEIRNRLNFGIKLNYTYSFDPLIPTVQNTN